MSTQTPATSGQLSPEVAACLAAAVAAPSIHNTQPWRFRVHGTTIDMYADRTRQLHVIDPTGRELLMSLGAALLNMRVAALAHGVTPAYELLPDREQPDLVARMSVGGPRRRSTAADRLNRAIPLRHSNRQPFRDAAVPDAVRADLQSAARAESAYLIFAENGLAEAVLNIVRTADNRRHHDPSYLLELAEWTAPVPGRHDGVPAYAYPTSDPRAHMPLRDFGLVHPGARFGWPAPFEDEALIGVLYTDTDGPLAWLNAGQALERSLLTATVHKVQATLMTQPLEIPQLRALFDDTTQVRVAQAIVRFGYAPPGTASPRRALTDVLLP